MSPRLLLVCALFAISYFPQRADSSCAAPCGGCYKDEPSKRALSTRIGRVNSPQQCINICKSKKAAYAGIQDGYGCWCGTNYDLYGRASNCNKKCGNGQVCGGWSANTVYATGIESLQQKAKKEAEKKAKSKVKSVIKDKAKKKFEKSGAKKAVKKVGKRIFKFIRHRFW